MKVLIVGGGGREHALAWKLARERADLELIAAPGNPGIATLGRCIPVPTRDTAALLGLAKSERADLTIVGPEGPLAAGIVDAFREAGLAIFGPTAAAARIEASKGFAKQLMRDAGVPTARAERHTTPEGARRAARAMGAPVVIKASGLAAGKGVLICATIDEADRAIDAMLRQHVFGGAGDELLVEEFMAGEELSLFVLTDGVRAIPMLPARDHKRLEEGDRGPNTGGMGAYAPVSAATPVLVLQVMSCIIEPTLRALREAGAPFTGLLYAGLMLTSDGPRVVEFNCRFGDPETQALLPLLDSDLLPLLIAVARGDPLDPAPLRWRPRSAVTTVVASEGYPDAPRTGLPIALPPAVPDVFVFHAGTALGPDGRLVTAGGRVFAVTALGDSLEQAQRASAGAARSIEFEGRRFRSDIGWRELARHAGAA